MGQTKTTTRQPPVGDVEDVEVVPLTEAEADASVGENDEPAPPAAPTSTVPSAAERPAGGAGEFTPERMLPADRLAPSRGWRHLVYRTTRVNLGAGRDERAERALVARAKAPIEGRRRVVVLSAKGGTGKTTVSAMIGHTFAAHRGDRVVALDASPDAGSLGARVRRESAWTVRDLLAARESIRTYADVRAYASQAPSRLEVVCSVATSRALGRIAFTGSDYESTRRLLDRFYSLLLVDCGPGLLHDPMGAILGSADQLVVVTTPSIDGGQLGSLTLDWLEDQGYGEHVRGAVVVVNAVHRADARVDLSSFTGHFAERCRAVVRVPWDPHLGAGTETGLERLAPATRRAFLELAAAIGDGFPLPRPGGRAGA